MSDDGLLSVETLRKITKKKRAHCQQEWFEREFGVTLPRNTERVLLTRQRFEQLQFIRAGLLSTTKEIKARPAIYSADLASRHETSRIAVSKHPPRKKSEKTREQIEHRRELVLHHANKRRALKALRIPAWANMDEIKAIYENAVRKTNETGIKHHVDHYYPLQGKTVCGLHVETNLRVITAEENLKKYNKQSSGDE